MRSLSYRTFLVDNRKYMFSREGFNEAIQNYRDKNSTSDRVIKMNDVYQTIADGLNISVDAVKKWKLGYNGPSDVEVIKNTASVLDCDYKDLLVKQDKENSVTHNKEIDMNIEGDEKDILKSLLCDLLAIVEDYAYSDFPDIRREQEDLAEHYINWLNDISIKFKKLSFGITKENYGKFERLYLETRCFIDCSFTGSIIRWRDIHPIFELFSEIGIDELHDYAVSDYLDWDELVFHDRYLEEDMREMLKTELDPYTNGYISWDQPLWVISVKFGSWYLELIRHDFPGLFID